MENNKFLAKSEPEETIMQHTENLLREYENLGILYPQLKENSALWSMLELVCLYHDFGKINKEFQQRIECGRKKRFDGEIHHAVLSAFCLNKNVIKREFSENQYALEIYSAVLFHHHREDLLSYKNEDIKNKLIDITDDFYKMMHEIQFQKDQYKRLSQAVDKYVLMEDQDGAFPKLKYRRNYYNRYVYDILANIEKKVRDKNQDRLEEEKRASVYIFLKGLLNRIDYAASAHIQVEHKNDFLEFGLSVFMKDLNKEREKKGERKTDWNELQRYMMENQDENVIVLAQTGMGKTEAALWWIGNSKGIFTLPLRTAINSIYERIRKKIIKNIELDNRLGLLHGESFEYYSNLQNKGKKSEEEALFDLETYYTKTRQLSLPLTITTLDQVFLFIFRYIGYEERLATMAYSKVVIDEVQMYGADLTAYLIIGLYMIQKMGGKFSILTATFPGFIQDLLEDQEIVFKKPVKKFIDDSFSRHSVKWIREEINTDFILSQYHKNNRVLVICNTVRKCQEIYKELIEKMDLSLEKLKEKNIKNRELNMLHAKYIKKDREKLEEAILEFTDKDSHSYGIWITSSIAEASLDIDFDILITELSDINSLFQRLGRCFRHRIWDGEGYNCFVFDGGAGTCSGVGDKMPIDEEIFLMSKDALRDYFDMSSSILTERTKMELVERVYSTENIKQKAKKYYNKIIDMLKKPQYSSTNELSAKEAQKEFRNILSFSIIPEPVFNDNEIKISEIEKKLKSEEVPYKEKISLKQRLHSYTVDVDFRSYRKMAKNDKEIYVSKYQSIEIKKCRYDPLIGIEFEENIDGGTRAGVFW